MYKATHKQLQAAKLRLNLESRGSDEEYMEHLYRELMRHDAHRRRGGKVVQTRWA